MIRQAKAFAARLHREAPDSDEQRLELGFQLAYGRSLSEEELNLGLNYLSGEDEPDSNSIGGKRMLKFYCSNELIYLTELRLEIAPNEKESPPLHLW